jgi:hypothetical protein
VESSLAIAPVPETYALYGTLLSALGEDERALSAFRSGLKLAGPAIEPLPVVRSLAPPADTEDAGKG